MSPAVGATFFVAATTAVAAGAMLSMIVLGFPTAFALSALTG